MFSFPTSDSFQWDNTGVRPQLGVLTVRSSDVRKALVKFRDDVEKGSYQCDCVSCNAIAVAAITAEATEQKQTSLFRLVACQEHRTQVQAAMTKFMNDSGPSPAMSMKPAYMLTLLATQTDEERRRLMTSATDREYPCGVPECQATSSENYLFTADAVTGTLLICFRTCKAHASEGERMLRQFSRGMQEELGGSLQEQTRGRH